MPLYPTWQDIAVRLVVTMLAGAMIGFNRGVHGHAPGLRTTILVGLAASVSMIQANILLPLDGKTAGSFAVMDLMRLPLGILTGVGFIGGGAILRRGDLVTGVTTAATLWAMTVIGLCLGGGQIILGITATLLAFGTLWALKWLDIRIPREHRAMLVIRASTPSIQDFVDLAALLGYKAHFIRQEQVEEIEQMKLWFEIRWKRPEISNPPFELLKVLNERLTVELFEFGPRSKD
jgi:putative Mg2+ transporter-C (MgtC) family protein